MRAVLTAFLLGGVLAAGVPEIFSPGGVESDWSRFDPKPRCEESRINFVENGSFELPGTDFKGKKGKGAWLGTARTHGRNDAPKFKVFQEKFREVAVHEVTADPAAAGKYVLHLKTPDDVAKWYKPFPQISNRVGQTMKIPVSAEDGLYRLVFKARGSHTPTAPNRGLFLVQLRGMKSTGKNQFRYEGKGIQPYFSLRKAWTSYSFDLRLPAGCTAAGLNFCLYGAGEAFVDDVRLYPVAAAADQGPVQVKVMPYSLQDNLFCLGEKLPGVVNFTFNAHDRKFKRKALLLELELPPGFRVVDARTNCPLTKAGENVWHIGLMQLIPLALKRPWYAQHGAAVMIDSLLPASEKLYTAKYRLRDGAWQGPASELKLKVIPAFYGKRPALFRSAAMVNNEWTFEKEGVRAITDFYLTSGFSCIFGAKGPVSHAMKKQGLPRYMGSSNLANGFRLGADPKPDFAQFRMADGKAWPRKICPVEVYTRGPYYKEAVYGKILKAALVDEDLTDNFMPNWEPYYLDSKGCFCNRCREEFVKFCGGKIPAEVIRKAWPGEILQKYADVYCTFRSRQHGKLMKALQEDISALGKAAGKESNFVPEISWRCVTNEHNVYCRQYNVKDYMYDFPWLEPWGPYVYNRAGQIYSYYPTIHLIPWVAGGMVKRFMAENFKGRKPPRLIAFPHSYQSSDWVTEPEALAFEILSYFVRGYDGVFCYYFPRGYDYRHWRSVAKANTLIARYENYTLKGRTDNAGVSLKPVTPLPEKLYYPPVAAEPEGAPGRYPGLSKLGPLQFQVWRLGEELLVCAGNFWQKGEIFFTLKAAGLDPRRRYGVEVNGAPYSNFTGKELAAGVLLQAGALRWRFIKIGAPVKGGFGKDEMKRLLEARRPLIEKAVKWEKEHYAEVSSYAAAENPVIDYGKLKKVSSAGVTVTPKENGFQVKCAAYSLTLDPSKGGRLHNWKAGNDVLVSERKQMGFGVPAVWYPANAAFVLGSGMKLERITPVKEGVKVSLSRVLSAKDSRPLAGVKVELEHTFTASGVTSFCRFVNLLEDAVEFSFRFHNVPALLGKKEDKVGSLRFASGEAFPRNFVQKIFRVGTPDPLLEAAFKRANHRAEAGKFPVTLSAPWSATLLEADFSPRPRALVTWDSLRSDCSSFEAVFDRVQPAPGGKAEFSMKVNLKHK